MPMMVNFVANLRNWITSLPGVVNQIMLQWVDPGFGNFWIFIKVPTVVLSFRILGQE